MKQRKKVRKGDTTRKKSGQADTKKKKSCPVTLSCPVTTVPQRLSAADWLAASVNTEKWKYLKATNELKYIISVFISPIV